MSSEAEEGLVYVYCIIPRGKYEEFGRIGIGGRADEIHTISHKELSAVVSRCKLPQYERSDENMLAHQRLVQKIFAKYPALPHGPQQSATNYHAKFCSKEYTTLDLRPKRLDAKIPFLG